MKKLDFKYISACNFLCFGPEGVEIDFTNLDNIVLIRGDNLDVHEEEEKVASNGIGKSSIPEILVYTLYGKTIKHPKKLTHKDVINNQTKKGLRTEVIWNKYRVVRKRKPNELRIWESKEGVWDDSTEITLGGMPATQKLIEDKIGLSYEAFINLVIFTDNNSGSFLELDGPTKREVVESLLGLGQYRQYLDEAKKSRNEAKEKVKTISANYQSVVASLKSCEERIAQLQQEQDNWKKQKTVELKTLEDRLHAKKQNLKKSDTGAALAKYNQAQEQIKKYNLRINEVEIRQQKVESIMKEVNEQYGVVTEEKHQLSLKVRENETLVRDITNEINKNEKTIKDLTSAKGTLCPTCYGVIKEENYRKTTDQCENAITGQKIRLRKAKSALEASQHEYKIKEVSLRKLDQAVGMAKAKMQETTKDLNEFRAAITELSKINKPVAGAEERILGDQIEDLKGQIEVKQREVDGPSPFVEIIKSAHIEKSDRQKEVTSKKEELEAAEADLPYYEFWVKAFGDNGIRKFVIDGIIPSFNARIAHWMQILIEGKIKLTFDNQLEETIERNPPDGDPFIYWAKSGGERRRLNLAVMLGWSYVTMLSSGVFPSVLWLDEVTSNIDRLGVMAVYEMILELAKEKQVFVTTHDQDLLDLLSGSNSLMLQKKNGFTKLL